ncbi:hypothetical protein SAMN02982996_02635 [Lonsdalea quercina]|uniref:Uncharacterized protein n=1 Tax=Lonsdalea quercina TaxID=71657 RepID=A0A1H4EGA5_9GAMM|nr:hypothetical protein SAMN02982996_02635 [Lonsdalea quercina]
MSMKAAKSAALLPDVECPRPQPPRCAGDGSDAEHSEFYPLSGERRSDASDD